MKVLFPLVLATIALARADKDDDFLAEVQRRIPNNSWKAKKINLEHEKKTRRMGWLKNENKAPLRSGINLKDIEDNYDPPAFFDAREQWDNCPSISKIWNQAACGSCWAFATATSMSDRLCIHKNTNFLVSPEDVLSCCKTTTFLVFEEQCGDCESGGYLEDALDYFVNTGVCSGGAFGENGTCKPYSIDPSLSNLQPTPACKNKCTDKSYSVSYQDDRKKGSNSQGHYGVYGQKFIMEEIEKNGPVSVGFIVYEDFMAYDSGIYQHTGYGEELGGHAVKIIGWGTENGIDYWLVVNSWSESWGEDGTFKFLRGVNHCDIEANAFTALP